MTAALSKYQFFLCLAPSETIQEMGDQLQCTRLTFFEHRTLETWPSSEVAMITDCENWLSAALLHCCCLEVTHGIPVVPPTFSAILTLWAYIGAKLESTFYCSSWYILATSVIIFVCLYNVKCCFWSLTIHDPSEMWQVHCTCTCTFWQGVRETHTVYRRTERVTHTRNIQ